MPIFPGARLGSYETLCGGALRCGRGKDNPKETSDLNLSRQGYRRMLLAEEEASISEIPK